MGQQKDLVIDSADGDLKELYIPSRSPFKMKVSRFKKNKRAVVGFWITIIFIVMAVISPWIAPFDPIEQDMSVRLEGPSMTHFFGTDQFGRDIFSRVLYGSRISLATGVVSVLVAVVLGVILGTISGYFGGFIDSVIMRIMDVFMAFPSFLLALGIVSVLGPGMVNVMIAIGVYSVPNFSRISRSAVISIKNMEYIEATESMGGKSFYTIIKHVIPNSISPIIVISTLRIATAIISAAGLSFLGMGAQPPTPEWGEMLSSGREYLRTAPHLSIIPGLAIMFLVLGFNMMGDGLRDALDSKTKV